MFNYSRVAAYANDIIITYSELLSDFHAYQFDVTVVFRIFENTMRVTRKCFREKELDKDFVKHVYIIRVRGRVEQIRIINRMKSDPVSRGARSAVSDLIFYRLRVINLIWYQFYEKYTYFIIEKMNSIQSH